MSHRFRSIADFHQAYSSGQVTPRQVAERVLAATKASDEREPAMRLFIAQDAADLMQQAEASTSRWKEGAPLGQLDGVPIAVKDEIHQKGYPTTVGTKFMGAEPQAEDATVVARLRAAGAMLIGKANMHEVGIGVTGINPHHGTARNPYNPEHVTGGSSSGPGAVVAAGLCPVAIGADGGGSIRIPAGLCGVHGIKATFGRVSEHGAAPICWSLAHIGPLGGSLRDCADVLALIAGEDAADVNTLGQPQMALTSLERDLTGLRIGYCEAWLEHAASEVRAAFDDAIDRACHGGAQKVPIEIAHLDHVRMTQYITIGVEMASSQFEWRKQHRRDYAADTRVLLEIASQVPAVDYVRAQRVRQQIYTAFAAAFDGVDVIATPTTATTAPPIPADALEHGQSDDAVLEALTAFSFAANLTGHPALSMPVGYDGAGLPIGLQIIGRHWDEATILGVADVLASQVELRKPSVYFDLLS